MTTQWRADGPYIASSALFSGMLEETQLFLQTFAEQDGELDERVEKSKLLLIDNRLPQRSRSSRVSIVRRISSRLTSWHPPEWVLDNLADFALQSTPTALKAALLMHVCRQDQLLYSLVHQLVLPKWHEVRFKIDTMDVQRFLDEQMPNHPEIDTWSRQTRERLGSTTLSIFRDYGLLQGKAHKTIVEPIVPDAVLGHVVRLLDAEGVPQPEIPYHPDWQLWLWDGERARRQLSELIVE